MSKITYEVSKQIVKFKAFFFIKRCYLLKINYIISNISLMGGGFRRLHANQMVPVVSVKNKFERIGSQRSEKGRTTKQKTMK